MATFLAFTCYNLYCYRLRLVDFSFIYKLPVGKPSIVLLSVMYCKQQLQVSRFFRFFPAFICCLDLFHVLVLWNGTLFFLLVEKLSAGDKRGLLKVSVLLCYDKESWCLRM